MSKRKGFKAAVGSALKDDAAGQPSPALESWLSPTTESRVDQVAVGEISDPDWRRALDPQDPAYRALKASVRASGILQPVLLRPLPGGGYQVISGMRRVRAARDTFQDTVPATVRPLTDVEAIVGSLDALMRDPIAAEEREAIAQRLRDGGMKAPEAAALLGALRLGGVEEEVVVAVAAEEAPAAAVVEEATAAEVVEEPPAAEVVEEAPAVAVVEAAPAAEVVEAAPAVDEDEEEAAEAMVAEGAPDTSEVEAAPAPAEHPAVAEVADAIAAAFEVGLAPPAAPPPPAAPEMPATESTAADIAAAFEAGPAAAAPPEAISAPPAAPERPKASTERKPAPAEKDRPPKRTSRVISIDLPGPSTSGAGAVVVAPPRSIAPALPAEPVPASRPAPKGNVVARMVKDPRFWATVGTFIAVWATVFILVGVALQGGSARILIIAAIIAAAGFTMAIVALAVPRRSP